MYEEAYQQHVLTPNSLTLAAYIELHNNYVQDVHACNAMADQFNNHVLPQLVQVSRQLQFLITTKINALITMTLLPGAGGCLHRSE